MKHILTVIIAVMIIVATVKRCQYENRLSALRENIEDYDSLVKVKNGQYSRMFSLYDDQKEIIESLRDKNSELANYVEKREEKILQLQQLYMSMEDQVDTVRDVKTDSVVIRTDTTITINTYYPDKRNWFVNYRGTVQDNTLRESWGFSTIPVTLAVTETQSGRWKTHLHGPSFIRLDSIVVSRMSDRHFVEEDNFGWLIGGGIGKNLTNQKFGIPVEGGIRFKNNYLLGEVSTIGRIELKFLREF